MMDWKIPYFADSTAAVVRHNWLLMVHGPTFTAEEERIDTARENYPEHMTRHDMPDNPKGRIR